MDICIFYELKRCSVFSFILSLLTILSSIQCKEIPRKNILLIASDDLRTELGCYVKNSKELGHLNQNIHTPNIDAFSKRSALFTHAFSQYPLCNPSRTSFLTGRRPQVTKVLGNVEHYRDTANFTTIPLYFKENGYTTLHTGKIFHESPDLNYDYVWHRNLERKFNIRLGKGTVKRDQSKRLDHIWGIFETWEHGNKLRYDDLKVEQAINYMKEIQNDDNLNKKPFFIGVGFTKNHLPLEAPKQFFDLYPLEDIREPPNYYRPKNYPNIANVGFCEMSNYKDAKASGLKPFSQKNAISKQFSLELRRAYYSTVSWVDYNVGRLVNAVKDLGLDKNTIIVFLADHGYHLGENNHWCKIKMFDLDLRVPLMIRVPGQTDRGFVSHEVVELLDIFPTLTELSGVRQLDPCTDDTQDRVDCVQGKSLAPLLRRTKLEYKSEGLAFSVTTRNKHSVIAYSVRNQRYRYTEWLPYNNRTACPNFDGVIGTEMYDIMNDPESNFNVFDLPKHKAEKEKLSAILRASWGVKCDPNYSVPSKRKRSNRANKAKEILEEDAHGVKGKLPHEGLSESYWLSLRALLSTLSFQILIGACIVYRFRNSFSCRKLRLCLKCCSNR